MAVFNHARARSDMRLPVRSPTEAAWFWSLPSPPQRAAQHSLHRPGLFEAQGHGQGYDGAGVALAEANQVLLGRRKKRTAPSGFLDQRLDLAGRVTVMVREVARHDDLRTDPAERGVEFLRSRNSGEGHDLAADQPRRSERVGLEAGANYGLAWRRGGDSRNRGVFPPSTISARTRGS